MITTLDQATKRLTALQEETAQPSPSPSGAAPAGSPRSSSPKPAADELLANCLRRSRVRSSSTTPTSINDGATSNRWFAALRRQRLGGGVRSHGRACRCRAILIATYNGHVGRLEGVFAALEDLAAGLPLPPRFGEAMRRRVTATMSRDYADQRMAAIKASSPASRSI